jgi:hypothetical protein
MTQRGREILASLQVALIEALDQEHRRQVVDRPQRAEHRGCPRLQKTGRQAQVLVGRLADFGDAGLARRERDQTAGVELEFAEDLRQRERLASGKNQPGLQRIVPAVEAVAREMEVARTPLLQRGRRRLVIQQDLCVRLAKQACQLLAFDLGIREIAGRIDDRQHLVR